MSEKEMDMELGNDILSLLDEEGNEHEFEVVDTYELGDARYLALVPVFEENEEMLDDPGELVILRVHTDENQEEYLEPIDNEDEFNKIAEVFMSRLEEEFDFLDTEE